MTNCLYRLFVGFLLVVSSGLVFASSPVQKYALDRDSWRPFRYWSSVAAACSVAAQERSADRKVDYTELSYVDLTCYNKRPDNPQYNLVYEKEPYRNIVVVMLCDNFSAPDTTKPLNLQCGTGPDPLDPSCASSTPFSITVSYKNEAEKKSSPFPQSSGKCQIKVESVTACWKTLIGVNFCKFSVSNKNAVPPSDPKPPVDEPPKTPAAADTRTNMPASPLTDKSSSCPGGSVSGGLTADGMTICIGTGTAPITPAAAPTKETAAPVTTNNPDGTKTTVSAVKTTNADGSVTTVTTTAIQMVDGSYKTSQTVSVGKTPGGDDGKSEDENDKDGFCKKNPTLNICKNSTVSGSCEEISCEGDAIQCATLKEAAIMECTHKKEQEDLEKDDAFTLGNAMAKGQDPLQGQFPTKANGQNVTMPDTLSTAGWLGAGRCFADKTITVQGRNIVIPLSKSCDYLVALRYALMVVAALVSVKIVTSPILS